MLNTLTIHTDGGSRGNPGAAAWGFIALAGDDSVVKEAAETMGTATNNEAEYKGFLNSVTWLLDSTELSQGIQEVLWKLDSKLVVEQLNKNWKIKEPRMLELAKQCWEKLQALPCEYRIVHVPRAENSAADALVNKALDGLPI
jgi:ribonuclease H / adenosylcobalamin/alpha-ribazole phosphatase